MSVIFENTEVWGIEHALRGMRNPMNSWNRIDSKINSEGLFEIGPNDLDLAKRLFKAGPEHRKYLRQIFVSVDISAPRYWWQEFDTYKIGTTANSCSTMHKLHYKKFEVEDFEVNDDDSEQVKLLMSVICDNLNVLREHYLQTKSFEYIRQMKKILPESYIQRRTITMNFEVLLNMVKQRKSHRLPEWKVDFMNWVNEVPYFTDIVEF